MFKDKIKELRVDNDLSLVQFAKMAGISKTSVMQYEAGKQNPSRKTIAKICEAFDVTEEWLLEEEIAAAEEMEETETEEVVTEETETEEVEMAEAEVEETETEEAETEEVEMEEAEAEETETEEVEMEEAVTEEAEIESEDETASKTEEPVTTAAEETEEPEAAEDLDPETAHTAAASERKKKKTTKKPAASNTKGESKMSKKKINRTVPPMPFPPLAKAFGNAGEQDDAKKAKADEMKDNYKELLKKYRQEDIDKRKTSTQDRKEKQAQAFERFMEMQETFADFVSENPFVLPFAPMYSIAPKKMLKQFMEIERMSNEFFKKQADAYADFCEKRKNMFRDMFTDAVTKNEESDAKDEAEE